MKKLDSYDPSHNNWFCASYNEGGELAGKNGKEDLERITKKGN